ncbi:MAG: hypothetical protein WC872_04455 [Candidatus Absconditabacterales bacterium]
MIVSFNNDGRKLKQMIIQLLKSGLVKEIKRINYVKSYKIVESKVISNQEKIIWIDLKLENKDKVLKVIEKFGGKVVGEGELMR